LEKGVSGFYSLGRDHATEEENLVGKDGLEKALFRSCTLSQTDSACPTVSDWTKEEGNTKGDRKTPRKEGKKFPRRQNTKNSSTTERLLRQTKKRLLFINEKAS